MSIQQNILLDNAAPGSFSPKTRLSHLRTFAHAGTLSECPSPLVCLGEPALRPSPATPGRPEAAASLHCSSICLSAMLWAILISGAPAPPRQGPWLLNYFSLSTPVFCLATLVPLLVHPLLFPLTTSGLSSRSCISLFPISISLSLCLLPFPPPCPPALLTRC